MAMSSWKSRNSSVFCGRDALHLVQVYIECPSKRKRYLLKKRHAQSDTNAPTTAGAKALSISMAPTVNTSRLKMMPVTGTPKMPEKPEAIAAANMEHRSLVEIGS